MSQNSADSSNGNNSKNIPTVVNKHADRLMDELFADIEDLLSGDLSEQKKVQPAALDATQSSAAKAVKAPSEQPVSYEPGNSPPPTVSPPAPIETPRPGGVWKKVVVGLGLATLLTGGGVWWLVKEGKINIGSMPVSGLSNSASNADIKFTEYLEKALNKVDSTSVSNPSASSVTIPNPPGAVEPTLPIVPGAMTSPATRAVPSQTVSGSFTKIIPGNPPTVEFAIDGVTQQVKAGEKIGNSGWVLTNAINPVDNEVVIKRNGEMRSLKAGQQF